MTQPTRSGPPGRRPRAQESRSLPRYQPGSLGRLSHIGTFDEVVTVDTVWEAHSHPAHELVWNQSGASTATIGPRTWTIAASLGLWIPAGVVHSATATAGTWYRTVHFGIQAIDPIAEAPTAVEITPLLSHLLMRLADDLNPQSRRLTEAMVLDVLEPCQHEIAVQLPVSSRLRGIADAVVSRPGDSHRLEAVAEGIGVSPRTVTRGFQEETGLGFRQWVSTVRAQASISLLAQGVELEQIAARMGYSSQSAFGAAFRRVTGAPPGAFRDVRFATEDVT